MANTPRSRPPATQTTVATNEPITVSIVEAIAEAKDTEATVSDIQLSDHVDLDALEALYAHSKANEQSTWEVQFHIETFEVTVRSDGRITVV